MPREPIPWNEASYRCQANGSYLPRWKTSQHMLSQDDEMYIEFSNYGDFDYAEVVFLGLVSKVSTCVKKITKIDSLRRNYQCHIQSQYQYFQNTELRWTDGAPLINFEYWNFPDVVNAFPHRNMDEYDKWTGSTKSPANEELSSYMGQLQPHFGSNSTFCAATFLPAFASNAWFLVPCDAKYKARLVCQL